MKIAAITPNRKHDALAAVIIEGIYDCGIDLIASDPGNGVKEEDVKNEDEFVRIAKDADYVWVLWGKGPDKRRPQDRYSHPRYHLLDKINRPEVTSYIDGSEWTSTGHPDDYSFVQNPWDPARRITKQAYEAKIDSSRYRGTPWVNTDIIEKCRWYFKRECYPEDTLLGIIPLNFGAEKRFFREETSNKKDIDILCSFGQTYTGLRDEIQKSCEKLKDEGYNVVINGRLNHQDYLAHMSRSHISIDAWGGGNNCMRMWEVMANKACCFTQRMDVLFPNKPTDGYHYVEYSTAEEFEKKIRYYLKHKDLCLQIGERAHELVKSFHTGKSRVEYMLDIIKGTK